MPRADNVIRNDTSCFEFALEENGTAAFIGEYEISAIGGIVTIYGSVLRSNSGPMRVYAPSISALPQIRSRQPGTTVRISSIMSGLRKLARLSPLFRNIWNADETLNQSFALLSTSDDDGLRRALYPLEIDRDMDMVLRTLSAKSVAAREQPRIMAVGGKSAGKSTFNRILCNHLNSWTPGKKCFYLDLDPGQPEFGPPGQVSLVEVFAPILGPPFTHPASSQSNSFRLIRSHTITATTFKDDPTHYKACAQDLIRFADRAAPLIINACGWTSGLGGSVLLDLFVKLAVTDAVLLEPLESDLVESFQSASRDAAFHRVSRRAPRPSTRSPAESRAMQTMAYFHTKIGDRDNSIKTSAKAVNHMRHWNASFASAGSGIAAVMSYNSNPHPEFLAETLDGSIVGIVLVDRIKHGVACSSSGQMLQDVSEHISRTPEGIPYVKASIMGINWTLDPSTCHCIGLALVRSIDVANETLQLITLLSEQQIEEASEQIIVLVKGSFDAPEWAYLEDIYKKQYDGSSETECNERPWVSQTGQVGVESSVWRLRHPPLAPSQ